VLLLNECLLLFISLSTQSGKLWIHPRISQSQFLNKYSENKSHSSISLVLRFTRIGLSAYNAVLTTGEGLLWDWGCFQIVRSSQDAQWVLRPAVFFSVLNKVGFVVSRGTKPQDTDILRSKRIWVLISGMLVKCFLLFGGCTHFTDEEHAIPCKTGNFEVLKYIHNVKVMN
jgi:hypothetical protein